MPHTITAFDTGTGFARYRLAASEAFVPEAASFLTEARSHNPPYGHPAVEWRDASDGLIYRQTFNLLLNDGVWFSLAAGAEPWYSSNNGPYGFPQTTEQQSNASLSARMPRIALTPGCSFNIYVLTAALSFEDDPMNLLSPDFDIELPHLWVEDVDAGPGARLQPGNPLLLGVGG